MLKAHLPRVMHHQVYQYSKEVGQLPLVGEVPLERRAVQDWTRGGTISRMCPILVVVVHADVYTFIRIIALHLQRR
jgi:hypothetical protein